MCTQKKNIPLYIVLDYRYIGIYISLSNRKLKSLQVETNHE